MPLPVGGRQEWPPVAYDPILDDTARWAAWYSGQAKDLDEAYGLQLSTTGIPWVRNRPSQYRGGILGAVARMFWGSPTPEGERPSKLHLPVASDIAQLSADLLFGEAPDLTIDATTATQGRLDEYVERGLWTDLREAAEIQAALGGVYLRVVWDREISDRPWLNTVHPDSAIPEWRWNKLRAVTFWRIIEQTSSRVVRHLERHEPGVILHAVYVGTRAELGNRHSLADFSETEALAGALTDGDTIETGTDRLTAVYVPNVRPNRIWRNIPVAANLGRSDYATTEPLMDALDETWTSWMRDIRLGKSRLIVPRSALDSLGPGQGAYFDSDRELMVGMDLTLDPTANQISEVQFAIRVAEHSATAQALVEQIVRSAGYSMQTFSGETTGQGVTATEVAAREKRSLSTRDRKIAYWTVAIGEAVQTLLAVDNAQFRAGVAEDRPKIEFPDAVSADPSSEAQTLKNLKDANLVSTETAVAMLHPDWDEEQVAAEVEALGGGTVARGVSQLGAIGTSLTQLATAQGLGAINDVTRDELVNRALNRQGDRP